jgi:hypothetical protein
VRLSAGLRATDHPPDEPHRERDRDRDGQTGPARGRVGRQADDAGREDDRESDEGLATIQPGADGKRLDEEQRQQHPAAGDRAVDGDVDRCADQRAGRGKQRRSPTPQHRDHSEQDQKAHQRTGADVLAVVAVLQPDEGHGEHGEQHGDGDIAAGDARAPGRHERNHLDLAP